MTVIFIRNIRPYLIPPCFKWRMRYLNMCICKQLMCAFACSCVHMHATRTQLSMYICMQLYMCICMQLMCAFACSSFVYLQLTMYICMQLYMRICMQLHIYISMQLYMYISMACTPSGKSGESCFLDYYFMASISNFLRMLLCLESFESL